MKVTKDRYELPLVVAESMHALARECGVDASVICHAIKEARRSQYVRVEVEDMVSE